MRIGIVGLFATTLSGCSLYFGHGDPGGSNDTPDARLPVPDAAVVCDGSSCGGYDFAAACRAPEGPAIVLDPSRVAAHLAGRWWLCGGAAEFFGNVEFTADQQFYMLSTVNGRFVRNLGPTTSGTYAVSPGPSGITFALQQRYQDGSGASYLLQGHLEDTPRKLLLGGGYYVAIP